VPITTTFRASLIKCPKRVLQSRTQNPLILQAEQRANMLAEKAYFFGQNPLWGKITRIPNIPQLRRGIQ
jgi:hypothetical protein